MFNGNENLFERDFTPTLAEELYEAIRTDDTGYFYMLFTMMHSEEIEDNLDWFIATAIEMERPEFTAFLLDYKAKHNLYTTPNWDI